MGAVSSRYRRQDLLRLKETVAGELTRIERVLGKLDGRLQRQVGRDLSCEELVLIFVEERIRLQEQIDAINESLEREDTADNSVDYNRTLQAKRAALLDDISRRN